MEHIRLSHPEHHEGANQEGVHRAIPSRGPTLPSNVVPVDRRRL